MPVLTQLPSANGGTFQWSNNYSYCTSDDADSSYIGTTNQNYIADMVMAGGGGAIPNGAVSPVNSCTCYWKCRWDTTNNIGAYYWGTPATWITYSAIAASYANYGGNWPSLEISGIDGVQTRIQSPSAGTVTGRCTYVARSVDYQLASGGFTFLFGLAGLMASPLIGRLTDFGHFSKMLDWWLRKNPYTVMKDRDEIMAALRDIRAYKHPIYFLPTLVAA
jgi:hypothetical protein